MWQLDRRATNASSGSTPAASDQGAGTTCGLAEAATTAPPSKFQLMRAAVLTLARNPRRARRTSGWWRCAMPFSSPSSPAKAGAQRAQRSAHGFAVLDPGLRRGTVTSMRLPRAFHDLGQHPAHVLGVEEEHQACHAPRSAVRPRMRTPLPSNQASRRVDVGHFEADMMLPAERILREEIDDRRVRAQAARSARSGCWAYRQSTPAPPAPASRTDPRSAPRRAHRDTCATLRSIEGVATPTWLRRPSFMVHHPELRVRALTNRRTYRVLADTSTRTFRQRYRISARTLEAECALPSR